MCKNIGTEPPSTTKTRKNQEDATSKPWVSPYAYWTQEDWKTREFPTRAEIKAVIPPHCFKRSAIRGFMYIIRDTVQVVACAALFWFLGLSAELPESALSYPGYILSWLGYGLVEGYVAGGLWIMGHECGHGAFSESSVVNDVVGWVLHSLLLVPYFSWAYSHSLHHRHCNDAFLGESFVPQLLDERWCSIQYRVYRFLGGNEILYIVWDLLMHFYWYWPLYLLGLVTTARRGADGKPVTAGTIVDHYRPNSRLFPPHMWNKVMLSNLGLVLTCTILYQCSVRYGFIPVLFWYGAPCVGVNCVMVVLSTWMQHTDPSVPHFGPSEWTWMKGALVGTIDRNPHFLTDYIAHDFCSTHVCHHLFPELPCYHSKEATAHVRAFLEPKGMYNYNPTGPLRTVIRLARHCHFVEGLDGLQFYKSFAEVASSGDGTKTTKKSE